MSSGITQLNLIESNTLIQRIPAIIPKTFWNTKYCSDNQLSYQEIVIQFENMKGNITKKLMAIQDITRINYNRNRGEPYRVREQFVFPGKLFEVKFGKVSKDAKPAECSTWYTNELGYHNSLSEVRILHRVEDGILVRIPRFKDQLPSMPIYGSNTDVDPAGAIRWLVPWTYFLSFACIPAYDVPQGTENLPVEILLDWFQDYAENKSGSIRHNELLACATLFRNAFNHWSANRVEPETKKKSGNYGLQPGEELT